MWVGCAREKSARSAEELLPEPAQGALVTAPLAGMAQDAAALLQRAGGLPGGEQLGEARRQVAAQLGFDPLSREGQLAAGLDPDRAAALVLLPGSGRAGWVAALPLTKPDLFAQTLDRLLRERAAFASRHDEARGKARVAVYSREGEPERVAFAVLRGYGVLARGPDPASDVAAAAERAPERSLAHDSRLAAARKQLGGQDLTIFAPAGSGLLRRLTSRPLPGDLAIGLTGTAGGLSSKLFFQASPPEAQRIQAAVPGGAGGLARFLPQDAPLIARAGLQPAEVLRGQREFNAPLLSRSHQRQGGLELARLLRRPVAVQPVPHRQQRRAADLTRPYRKIAFDEKRLQRALTNVAATLPKLGAKATSVVSASVHADTLVAGWKVRYPAGPGPEFGIARLHGKTVVAYLIGGGIEIDDLKEDPPTVPALGQDAGAAVLLDLGKLAEKVRGLPETAYGSGPQAYVARSLVSQVVDPAIH